MFKRYVPFVCCFALAAGLIAVPARGGDWPQWGGAGGRNMVSDERRLPESFTPGEKPSGGSAIDPATMKNANRRINERIPIHSTRRRQLLA